MADLVSITVTTCNREDALAAVLRSLSRVFFAAHQIATIDLTNPKSVSDVSEHP